MIEEIKLGEVYVWVGVFKIKVVKVIKINKRTVWFRQEPDGYGQCEDWLSLKEFKENYLTPEQLKNFIDKEVTEFREKYNDKKD